MPLPNDYPRPEADSMQSAQSLGSSAQSLGSTVRGLVENIFGSKLPGTFKWMGMVYSLSPLYEYIQQNPAVFGILLQVFATGRPTQGPGDEDIKAPDLPGTEEEFDVKDFKVSLKIQWFLWKRGGHLVNGVDRDDILAGRQRIGNFFKARADVDIVVGGLPLSPAEWIRYGFAYTPIYEMSLDGKSWCSFHGGGRDPIQLKPDGTRVGMVRSPDPPFLDVNVGGVEYSESLGGAGTFAWDGLYAQPSSGPLYFRVSVPHPMTGELRQSNVIQVEVA